MLTKERRDEIRRTMDAPGDRAFALKIRGEDVMFSLPRRGRGDSLLIDALLDALDEMERSKAPPAASAPELTDEILRARVTTQWRSDAKRWARQAGSEGAAASDLLAALLALDEMERERDELAEGVRAGCEIIERRDAQIEELRGMLRDALDHSMNDDGEAAARKTIGDEGEFVDRAMRMIERHHADK